MAGTLYVVLEWPSDWGRNCGGGNASSNNISIGTSASCGGWKDITCVTYAPRIQVPSTAATVKLSFHTHFDVVFLSDRH